MDYMNDSNAKTILKIIDDDLEGNYPSNINKGQIVLDSYPKKLNPFFENQYSFFYSSNPSLIKEAIDYGWDPRIVSKSKDRKETLVVISKPNKKTNKSKPKKN